MQVALARPEVMGWVQESLGKVVLQEVSLDGHKGPFLESMNL